MRKVIGLILIFTLIFVFSACGRNNESDNETASDVQTTEIEETTQKKSPNPNTNLTGTDACLVPRYSPED